MNQVNELESAILARAQTLAAEYRTRAERSRDNILKDAAERLHLLEEREVLVAKAMAERAYRRLVQSSELKLQKQMDLLRWNMVQGVLDRLTERIQALAASEAQYLPLLQGLISTAAEQIERDQLVIEVNRADLLRLEPQWSEFAQAVAPKKSLALAPEPIETLGGALVRSADNHIRVDNTFEGRIQRLQDLLHRQIVERLLPASRTDLGTLARP